MISEQRYKEIAKKDRSLNTKQVNLTFRRKDWDLLDMIKAKAKEEGGMLQYFKRLAKQDLGIALEHPAVPAPGAGKEGRPTKGAPDQDPI